MPLAPPHGAMAAGPLTKPKRQQTLFGDPLDVVADNAAVVGVGDGHDGGAL